MFLFFVPSAYPVDNIVHHGADSFFHALKMLRNSCKRQGSTHVNRIRELREPVPSTVTSLTRNYAPFTAGIHDLSQLHTPRTG